ncbi:MAG: hypothetical protein HY706_14125 [Candidatus Hydrogenedentes bacterium]|nr:hypothetical protein [Candidatus Hydrogenedentota bacterium]
MKPTNIRIVEIEPSFSEVRFRTPLKFGAGAIDSITLFSARVGVESTKGDFAQGLGAVLLSDLWAYPTPGSDLTHPQKDAALRDLSLSACQTYLSGREFVHPFRISMELKRKIAALAKKSTRAHKLKNPIPVLAAQMCASAVDCALHDAFGKVHGIATYDAYSQEFMEDDLSVWLGPDFVGLYPGDFLKPHYEESLPVWHVVGGSDKLTQAEKTAADPQDGLPVSLDEWIARDGVFCLKIKLRGADHDWDVERTIAVDQVAREALAKLGERQVRLSVDSNEMCPGPDYVLEYLNRLRAKSPQTFEDLLYIEQPTERDLKARKFNLGPVAALKPVLADESVTDVERCELAFELGWSGVALKTCKGHASALLYAAMCAKAGKVYSVQDLTNPGVALIHSAGLAARLSPLFGVEYNARQFIPNAQPEIQAKLPALFRVENGRIRTDTIPALGLGL